MKIGKIRKTILCLTLFVQICSVGILGTAIDHIDNAYIDSEFVTLYDDLPPLTSPSSIILQ